jgi:hypothetical protein
MDRILNMILRQVIGRVVNKGIDMGVDRATRGRNADAPTGQQQSSARETSRNVKGAMRMFRRIGRN